MPPLFPLQAAAGKRYLIDRNGDPVFLNGDTCWSLIGGATLAEAEDYFDDRAARGFNATIISAPEHTFTNNSPTYRNQLGDLPFDAGNNFDQPTAAYWDHAHDIVAYANTKGIIVFLDISYLGFDGASPAEGWRAEIQANSTTQLRTYGRFIGDTFKDLPNIVYMHGGDAAPAAELTKLRVIADAIIERDGGKMHTGHLAPESSARDSFGSDVWLSLDNTYSYADALYQECKEDYNQGDPFVLLESHYENGFGGASRLQLRRQAWWAVMCGACGVFFGNGNGAGTAGIWPFASDWAGELGSNGSQDAARIGGFLRPLRWFDLVPDAAHALITAGLGTDGQVDRLEAALSANGNLGLAYIPTNRQITIDRTQMSGTFRGRWWDPTNGSFSAISGSPWPNTGTVQITPAATNAAGSTDWVLLLEAL